MHRLTSLLFAAENILNTKNAKRPEIRSRTGNRQTPKEVNRMIPYTGRYHHVAPTL